MKKIITSIALSLGISVLAPLAAFAHVVVTPAQANIGETISFSLSVPNERDSTMTQVKLAIPDGVSNVSPDVAGGWDISTEKSGDTTTSITWKGSIPAGQRADLAFKAQVPASAGELDWKAYQTYADNTLVSWDQKPVANAPDNDAATSGPYSITKVTNDLATTTTSDSTDVSGTLTIIFSVVALVFSLVALFLRRRRA